MSETWTAYGWGTRTDAERKTGWTWGTTNGEAEWLTVAGSALYDAPLMVDRAAVRPPAPLVGGGPQTLARVERFGTLFKILELAPESEQHQLIVTGYNRIRGFTVGWCTCSAWGAYDYQRQTSDLTAGWEFIDADPAVIKAAYERDHGPGKAVR